MRADYLTMDAVTAAMLRAVTQGDEARLDPRAATGGRFVLPVAVSSNPAFDWLGDVLGELETVTLGPEAWAVADA